MECEDVWKQIKQIKSYTVDEWMFIFKMMYLRYSAPSACVAAMRCDTCHNQTNMNNFNLTTCFMLLDIIK